MTHLTERLSFDRFENVEQKLQEIQQRIDRLVWYMQPVDQPFWIPVSAEVGPTVKPAMSGTYMLTLTTGELKFAEYDDRRQTFTAYDWKDIAAWARQPQKFTGANK